jgi:hypothetical protein
MVYHKRLDSPSHAEPKQYRVYYNYVKVGDDGMTPAMRLGLARKPVEMEDILYFK